MKRALFYLLLLPHLLLGDIVETFYGPLEVTEPVLLELIQAPTFQRLKHIHQYGVSYYHGTHNEEYTRYDHSLGVFAVLRLKNRPLDEQIAGLLHDVSHTVFSHVGDWIFEKTAAEIDYQTEIHADFLDTSELGNILKKYNYVSTALVPIKTLFPALKNSHPNLCADRIDYNIQGAYFKNYITRSQARQLLDSLEYRDGKWICHNQLLMAKVTQFSLHMTKNCWGSPANYVMSQWLADAILKGVELKLFTNKDIHFNTDEFIWNKLANSDDPFIKERVLAIKNTEQLIQVFPPFIKGDLFIKSKFRGIDPEICHQDKLFRLTLIDKKLGKEFMQTKEEMEKGWSIKYLPNAPSARYSGDHLPFILENGPGSK